MKPIIITPNPVLNTTTKPVVKISPEIRKVLTEMKEALLSAVDPVGVGLAAPQIGYLLRIFAIKPTVDAKVTFFLNPEIMEVAKDPIRLPEKNTPLEGCLSIPNTWGVVERKKSITLKYLGINGKEIIKTFSGFPAVIIQHEMDHLQGILFTQRVLEQKRKLYEILKNEEGEESLKELPL